MRGWLVSLSDFGDAAVLLPLAAVMLIWLLGMGAARGAAYWTVAVVLCAGVTAALKISFDGCPPAHVVRNPSGHTSLSTLVYGAVTLVTAVESAGLRRIAAIGGGCGLVLAIAASRVMLGAHSTPEVGIGLAIGITALSLFSWGYLPGEGKRWRLPLFWTSGLLLLIMHGKQLTSEHFLHRITEFLGIYCH